jgi:predicted ATP-grasp superfamily ATP-dependent carboligase
MYTEGSILWEVLSASRARTHGVTATTYCAQLAVLTGCYDDAGPHEVLHQQLLPAGGTYQPVLDVRGPHDVERHVALQRVRYEDGDRETYLDALRQPEISARWQ